MAKQHAQFQCRECATLWPKWSGQCQDCKSWNSIEEIPALQGGSARGSNWHGSAGQSSVITLDQIPTSETPRFGSQIDELDRVLGGGLVEGSVVLLGGDPGIGKSTILLQSMTLISQQRNALYVTGEESPQQVSMRARRLGLPGDHLQLLSSTCVEDIIAQAATCKPEIMVIDSIQTIFSNSLQSAPGSVGQIRESTAILVRLAKQSNITLLLVGHVTQEGQLAGPRVLEHMLDTVLYFEGDAT